MLAWSANHAPTRLSPGTKLGPYEIVAPLGAGGMGEDDRRMAGAIQPQRIILRDTREPVDGGAVSYAAELRRGYHSSTVSIDFPNVTAFDPMYDVSPDGQHFAVLTADRTKSTSITLLTNWTAELKR